MTEVFLADGVAPEACTLPTAERPLRLAEFTDVFRSSLVAIDQRGPQRARLILQGRPELADTVRDLAARETECCSFFTFAVQVQGVESVQGQDGISAQRDETEVLLDVEVPAAYADVLSGLINLAKSASGVDGA